MCLIKVSNTQTISRRSDNERLHVSVESATGDKRKEPPLPPIKGDGSVDYDGESVLYIYVYLDLKELFLCVIYKFRFSIHQRSF